MGVRVLRDRAMTGREDLERVVAEHRVVATGLGEWCCSCSPTVWRPSAHRARHLTDHIAPLIEQARRDGAAEFAHWVATQRAYNGSDHDHGQSLYNECINGVLPTWAVEWGAEQATRSPETALSRPNSPEADSRGSVAENGSGGRDV